MRNIESGLQICQTRKGVLVQSTAVHCLINLDAGNLIYQKTVHAEPHDILDLISKHCIGRIYYILVVTKHPQTFTSRIHARPEGFVQLDLNTLLNFDNLV